MTATLFAAAGIAVGGAQAALLARATGTRALASSFFIRYALVAAVLVFAAKAGHLGPAAAGWAVGFGSGAALAYRRLG